LPWLATRRLFLIYINVLFEFITMMIIRSLLFGSYTCLWFDFGFHALSNNPIVYNPMIWQALGISAILAPLQQNTSLRIMATNDKQSNHAKALRKVLATLDVQHNTMENEAYAIYLELTTPPEKGVKPMGVDTPLVDDHGGYPRGDIDVYQAKKSLRNCFWVLQTDHKEVSGKIKPSCCNWQH
jgi:hypothetical protein